jgi:preprotein translocase subunit SecA
MSQLKTYRSITDRIWPAPRRIRRRDQMLVQQIRFRAQQLAGESDEGLLRGANDLRQRLHLGLDVLSSAAVVESFALTTEALRRVSGKVYYDVQLQGGLVLATGSIAEMQTGEGKTITCALPAVLYGLTGGGVHVATTNAYLAARDHEELIPVFERLGLSSGLIGNEQQPQEKRKAYECDITYGTGYEFGFDFLRDQLALRNRPQLQLGTRFLSRLRGKPTGDVRLMQRALAFAIIDEVDSVLIDEATTPLILSGTGGKTKPDRDVYQHAMTVADNLLEEGDYVIDPEKKTAKLTDEGWKTIHQNLPPQIQSRLQRPWSQYVEQSLRARLLIHREIDYVVQDDEVVIVDQNTGRLHAERKWRSGLHQSVEIREGVPLTEEREIEARITRQRYFRFYQRMCGMTGTALGNEAELLEFYNLPVIAIPRNKPSQRVEIGARYFGSCAAKHRAIVEDIARRQRNGQPVLVGTTTIARSQVISQLLEQQGISHVVLNGTQNEGEAAIVAKAGTAGTVTIATNMAGRGTDIRLDDRARVAGGLHVIVVEHHESPRVDRQLVGRSARQSDPGSCQFFVCSEDEFIVRYDAGLSRSMKRSASDNGECRSKFDHEVTALQNRIEKLNYAARQKMVTYDRWTESVQKSVAKLA